MKEEKGITIVSLVVTIVILLILVGISISALTGDSGIINKAKEAKSDTEYSQWEEKIDIAIINAESKYRNPELIDVIEELYKDGIITEKEKTNPELIKDGIITTVDGKKIEGKLDEYIPFGPGRGYAEKNETYDDGTNTATIPEGFKISDNEKEQKVDDGLVIEDKQANQFVWIPVDDINDMSQCSTAGGNCNLQLQGNTLRCTTHNSEDIVGKLYATDAGESFGTVNTTYDKNSGFREPAIITGDSGSNCDAKYYSNAGFNSLSDMEEGLKEEYKEMATSVAKYHGFYIGRYELGIEGTETVVKNASANTDILPLNAGNSGMWYGLYSKCKEFSKQNNENSIVSTMIWGSQYDAMLNWMEKQGENVTSANYSKQNNSYVTGKNPNDIIKNIYDLYGCTREWTLEASHNDCRINRGGYLEGNVSPSYLFNPYILDQAQWRWFN